MHEGSFAGFFRSAASGFRNFNAEEAELESNPYMSMADADLECQNDFERRWQGSNPMDAFRSATGLFGSQAKEPPSPRGFFQGAREKGFIQTLTPGFLRNNEQEEDFASTCCPTMSIKQRIFGCACCFAAGQLLQFFAATSFAGILIGHPGRFARCYSMGNMMMISGSFFLSGPKRQLEKVRQKDRLPCFCSFIAALVLTLAAVYSHPFLGRALLILVLVVIQWCAQVWYILSYIPYGHTVGRRVVKSLFGWCCTC